MHKSLPRMTSDQEAEDLLAQDLSDYLSKENFTPVSFEFADQDEVIMLQVSIKWLNAVKKAAKSQGISYQQLITDSVENALIN